MPVLAIAGPSAIPWATRFLAHADETAAQAALCRSGPSAETLAQLKSLNRPCP